MSDIDTIEHFLLGYFYGIPVYQPLESGWIGRFNENISIKAKFQSKEPNVSARKIIIGGGDGEHPAIIFHDLEYCVAKFLVYKFRKKKLFKDILTKASNLNSFNYIEYCNWNNETHRMFWENCKPGYSGYSDDMGLEEWLVLNIGEFIYISLYKITDKIEHWHNKIGEIEYNNQLFLGVLILPPGYSCNFGYATNPSTFKKQNGISRYTAIANWPDYHEVSAAQDNPQRASTGM